MITTYSVTMSDGRTLSVTTLAEASAFVRDDPGARVEPVVRYSPCRRHKAYEATNCPLCRDAGDN